MGTPAPKQAPKKKGFVRARYESSGQVSGVTLSLAASDVRLKGTVTDATFLYGPSLDGLSFGVEKPGHFMFDYDVAHQSARFQFHTQVSMFGKPLKLTYIHPQKRNATLVEGQYVLDPRNKVIAKYSFVTEKGSLKYSYINSNLNLTVEPGYDFQTKAWHFAVAKKMYLGDTLKAHFDCNRNVLGVEWIRDNKDFGSFKILGSVGVHDTKPPKFMIEKTWDAEF